LNISSELLSGIDKEQLSEKRLNYAVHALLVCFTFRQLGDIFDEEVLRDFTTDSDGKVVIPKQCWWEAFLQKEPHLSPRGQEYLRNCQSQYDTIWEEDDEDYGDDDEVKVTGMNTEDLEGNEDIPPCEEEDENDDEEEDSLANQKEYANKGLDKRLHDEIMERGGYKLGESARPEVREHLISLRQVIRDTLPEVLETAASRLASSKESKEVRLVIPGMTVPPLCFDDLQPTGTMSEHKTRIDVVDSMDCTLDVVSYHSLILKHAQRPILML